MLSHLECISNEVTKIAMQNTKAQKSVRLSRAPP